MVEVNRKAYLASIVPVIINAILSEHQIVADIVAFVSKGDFPRSRLGEKQRGKILAGWVTRKMRTMAQFAIRDLDPAALGEGANDGTDPNRASTGSLRGSGMHAPGASSLRNVEQAPRILEQDEFEQHHMMADGQAYPAHQFDMPDDQKTPTGQPPRGPMGAPDEAGHSAEGYQTHTFMSELDSTPIAPHSDLDQTTEQRRSRLPGVDGRESLDMWDGEEGEPRKILDDADEWTSDAMMHMNLAGNQDRK